MKFKKIEINNFKKLINYTVEFDEKNEFYGFNGVGKTTILDSIVWCLFGTNYKDESRFDINPIIDGITRYDLYPAVTLTLIDDSEFEYNIKRSLKQGNVGERSTMTEIDVNGSKFGIKAFEKYIQDKFDINKEEFKLLSNINYAANLSQKDLRSLIINLVGDVSDEEIFEENNNFNLIKDKILLVGVDKFKKDLSQSKTKNKDEGLILSGKIQNEEATIQSITINEEEVKINNARKIELLNVFDNYKKKVDEENKKMEEFNKVSNKIIEEKNAYKTLIDSMENIKQNGIMARNQLNLMLNVENLRKKDLNEIELELSNFNFKNERELEKIKNYEKNMNELISSIDEEKERVIVIDEKTCKYCGQNLPQDKIEFTKNKMEKEKQQKIAKMEEEFANINKEIESLFIENSETKNKINELENKKAEIAIKDYSNSVYDNPEVNSIKEKIDLLQKEFVNKRTQIQEKKYLIQKLEENQKNIPKPKQVPSVESVKVELDTINKRLSLYETLKYHKGNLEKLAEESKILNDKKVYLEAMSLKLNEYIAFKTSKMNEKLAEKFHLINFKTSDFTNDGKEVECFEIQMDGKSFKTLSGGEKMLASFDLITGIQSLKHKKVPILVDSIGELSELPSFIETQIITCRAIQKPNKKVKKKDQEGNVIEIDNPNYEKAMLIYNQLNVRKD